MNRHSFVQQIVFGAFFVVGVFLLRLTFSPQGLFAIGGRFSSGLLVGALCLGWGWSYFVSGIKRPGRLILLGSITGACMLLTWWYGLFFGLISTVLGVWLFRVWVSYRSVFSTLIDIGITGVAVCAALWSFSFSGSFLGSMWLFFLFSAAVCFVPEKISWKRRDSREEITRTAFHSAEKNAEQALMRMSKLIRG